MIISALIIVGILGFVGCLWHEIEYCPAYSPFSKLKLFGFVLFFTMFWVGVGRLVWRLIVG